jgi:hypothetical protein
VIYIYIYDGDFILVVLLNTRRKGKPTLKITIYGIVMRNGFTQNCWGAHDHIWVLAPQSTIKYLSFIHAN